MNSTARPESPIRVKLVTSEREFSLLSEQWEALQERAALTSVFESFDWQYLWWKVYGRGHDLRLLLAEADGELVGILPIYLQRSFVMHCPVRLLRFVGTGGDTFPDDLGPVLAVGHEEQTAHALAKSVLELREWDLMLLSDMNPECAFTKAIGKTCETTGLYSIKAVSERIQFVDLPPSFEGWLQSLHRDRRYRIRNARKKLNAAHSSRFFVWMDPSTLDEGIDHLIRLHHKRWKSIGMADHAFNSERYIDFHRRVMNACLARDRLRLFALELSGQIAAMFYFYKFRDRVYLMQSGFDPDHADLKPGQVLLGHIVEHSIGEHMKVLDFLRGDHRYKDELATGERETVQVTAFRQRPGAWAYRTRRLLLPAVKAALLDATKKVRSTVAEFR